MLRKISCKSIYKWAIFFIIFFSSEEVFCQNLMNGNDVSANLIKNVQLIGFEDSLFLAEHYKIFYNKILKLNQTLFNYSIDSMSNLKPDVVFEMDFKYDFKFGEEIIKDKVYCISLRCRNNYTDSIIAQRDIAFYSYKECYYNRKFKNMVSIDSLGVIYLLSNIFHKKTLSDSDKNIKYRYNIVLKKDRLFNNNHKKFSSNVRVILNSLKHDYQVNYLKSGTNYKYDNTIVVCLKINYTNIKETSFLLSFSMLDKQIASKNFKVISVDYGQNLDALFDLNKFIIKTISSYVSQ